MMLWLQKTVQPFILSRHEHNVGGDNVSKMYVGSTEITKAYIGDTLMYGGWQPIAYITG